jgi:hypothetical protein
MSAGDHGSTFAGNPLVCATACSVFDKIAAPAFLAGVTSKGERLRAGLREALKGNSHVKEVSPLCAGVGGGSRTLGGVLMFGRGRPCVTQPVPQCTTIDVGVSAKGERLRAGLREALKGNSHVKEVSYLYKGPNEEGVAKLIPPTPTPTHRPIAYPNCLRPATPLHNNSLPLPPNFPLVR